MTDIVPIPAAPTVPIYPALGSANFNNDAYNYGSSMPGVVSGLNLMIQAGRTNAVATQERAVIADEAASTAVAARDQAVPAGAAAVSARDQAVPAAAAAVEARDQAVPAAATAVSARDAAVAAAAIAGAPLVASSTSSLTVGIATQNLNVGLGKGFAPGQTVTIARVAAPATVWMRGTVLTYSSTGSGPLSVAVAEVASAGTFADWSISVAGNRGASSLTLPVVGVAVATTGAANVFYRIDAPVELKMPATPNDGDFFAFANRSGAVPTINPNGKKIKGDSSILSLNTLNASACLKYDAANGDWVESFAGYTVASVSSNAILLQPNTWTAKQTFQGYTVLGDSGAPSIKQRLLTGTTPAAGGGTVALSLGGVDFRKIVALSTVVQAANDAINEANSISAGFQFSVFANASGVVLQLSASNSANLFSRAFTVLVTYTE